MNLIFLSAVHVNVSCFFFYTNIQQEIPYVLNGGYIPLQYQGIALT